MEDYSVWGLPPEHVRNRVKKVMDTLRSEFGGPEFEPHITVVRAIRLSTEDAIAKFRSASKGLRAYTVYGRGVHGSKGLVFYPTPQAVGASDHCCRHFCYNRPTPYTPHMSLLYTDLTDEEKQKAMERANAIDDNFGNLSFTINRLALYKTDTGDKTLKSWEKVAECDLETA